MNNFLDIVGGKGIMKLVEILSKGIGAVAAPKLIKMTADAENYKQIKLADSKFYEEQKKIDAKCYELEKVSSIIKSNPEICITYAGGVTTMENTGLQDLAQRALNRLHYKELKHQLNIENVVYHAYEELKNDDEVSDEPVNDDWILRFFNSIENIGNEELQKIWGRILAGEIKKPNSYSYRALTILKDMTQQEIEIFQKVAKLAINADNKFLFISDNEQLLNKYGVFYYELLILNDAGILSTQRAQYTSYATSKISQLCYNNKFITNKISTSNEKVAIEYSVYLFTQSGKELLNALELNRDSDYILEFSKELVDKYKTIKFTAHNIIKVENDNIEYSTDDIFENS